MALGAVENNFLALDLPSEFLYPLYEQPPVGIRIMAVPTYSPGLSPKCPVVPKDIRRYIVRPDNTMVPLVPADQLPFRIHGIPSVLDHEQLENDNWKYAGRTTTDKCPLAVQAPAQQLVSPPASPNTGYRAPDYDVKTQPRERRPVSDIDLTMVPYSGANHVSRSAAASMEPANSDVGTYAELPATNTRFVHAQHGKRQSPSPKVGPSGIVPDPSKKEYCTYWIKNGECAYIATGCIYKHEMPTVEILRQIGFKGTPSWYKEKQKVGPTWLQRTKKEDDDVVYRGPPSGKPRDRGVFGRLSRDPDDDISDHDLVARPRPVSGEGRPDHVLSDRRPVQALQTATKPQADPIPPKPEIPNLIDLDDPPTPAPTRRESVISLTTTESTIAPETDSSSSLDRTHARISKKESPEMKNLKSVLQSKPEGSSPGTQEAIRPTIARRGSSGSNPQTVRFTEAKPTTAYKKKGIKVGLAGSRHAEYSNKPISAASPSNQIKDERKDGSDVAAGKKNITKHSPKRARQFPNSRRATLEKK